VSWYYCPKHGISNDDPFKCPICGEDGVEYEETDLPHFDYSKKHDAPAGWLRKESYEISRSNVEKMVKSGELSMADIKEAQQRQNLG